MAGSSNAFGWARLLSVLRWTASESCSSGFTWSGTTASQFNPRATSRFIPRSSAGPTYLLN
eukprot:CAMPEP_0179195166 /NCGR_PEP_ID=MMETSP0796-20121207/97011_1 /TAXON_ID=73915 /ORGANISM="Pyrodinium bahamense, Strain pbaha01" /LENGTH=60 /DNA_ID=CAMNT_0020899511 /DNA_START=164 /DNA_END=346 /DNA_ORIENTATION=+